jgi:site-specific DNA-methyltransferase (adenine-specific)
MLEINQIHHGDCLALMPSIPDKSIDMILCDLPYGTTMCEWDSIIDMGKLWNEYERVIKDNGAIVLTASASFTFTLGASNRKLFKYKWVWYKSLHFGFLNAHLRPMTSHEDILVFYKKQPVYNPQKRMGFKTISKTTNRIFNKQKRETTNFFGNANYVYSNEDGSRMPIDVLEIDNPNHQSIHPTQKPVALFEYLIKTYTNENDLVLDNCSGSGTTAIACINSNRRYICIEKNEEYIKRSRQRVQDHEPLLRLTNG